MASRLAMSLDLGVRVQALVQWGFLVLLLIVFWAVMMRPARRQRQDMQRFQDELAIGDPVVTAGGIFGTIARVEGFRVGLEVAPGVIIEVSRQAVVRKVDEPEPAQSTEIEHEADTE